MSVAATATIAPAFRQSLLDLFDDVRRVGGYHRLNEATNPGATETLRGWATAHRYVASETTDDLLSIVELTVQVPGGGQIIVQRQSERGPVRGPMLTTDPVLLSLLEAQRRVQDALAATESEDLAMRARLRGLGIDLGLAIGRRTLKLAVEKGA